MPDCSSVPPEQRLVRVNCHVLAFHKCANSDIFTRGNNGAGPQSVLDAEAFVYWRVPIFLKTVDITNIHNNERRPKPAQLLEN